MTRFEQYLMDLGYEMCVWSFQDEKFIPTNKHFISTLSNLYMAYVKDDLVVGYGLREKGLPPCLLFPRPKIKVYRFEKHTIYGHDGIPKDVEGVFTYTETSDSSMHIVEKEKTPQEIYKAMFDETIIFEFDLTDK